MWFDFDNIVVEGKIGSGRKTTIKKLCHDNKMSYVPIGHKVDNIRELIQLYFTVDRGVCLVVEEASKMSVQASNVLLKVLECNRPNRQNKIILVYDNYYDILPTILSRCAYHKVFCERLDLQEYIKENFKRCERGFEIANRVCSTFNEASILKNSEDTIEETFDLCNKIINNLGSVSMSNFMKIYTYFDRLDFHSFLIIIRQLLREKGLFSLVKITDTTISSLEYKVLSNQILINEWLMGVYLDVNE